MKNREHAPQPEVSAFAKGLALLKKYPGLFPPDSLSPADQDLFSAAVKTIDRAGKLKEMLGDEVTGDHAADVFRQMAMDLATHPGNHHDRERQAIEERLATLASPFLEEGVGLGSVLQSARDNREEALEAYEQMIRDAELPQDLQEALVFLKGIDR